MTPRRRSTAILAGVTVALVACAPSALGFQRHAPHSHAGATGATGSTGSTGPGGTTAPLVASVSACRTGVLPADRNAVFASQMTAFPGTRTMSVEFVLQERTPHSGGFAPVDAPGFATWVTSQPGILVFTYSHEVTGLPAPAAFRVLVRARWIGHHHHAVHHAVILSPVCGEPLLQPDLAIGSIVTRPLGARALYRVTVRNRGEAAAGPFEVTLDVAGSDLPPATVQSLTGDSSQLVQFIGPRCTAGSRLVATADPAGAVAEPPDPARQRSFACPR
jgi:CARDB